MRSIPMALTVDYVKRARVSAICVLLYLIGIPALVQILLIWQGLADPWHLLADKPLEPHGLLLALVGFMVVVFVGQRDKHFGVTSRLYVLPLPTVQLVTLRLLQAAVTVFLLCVVTMEANKLLFGMKWPTWGPALALAVFAMWIHAAYWTMLDFRFWKLVALAAVFTGLVWWLASRAYPNGFYEPPETWNGPTQLEVFTMLLAALSAGAMSVLAVARHRRGDCESPAAWFARQLHWLEPKAGERRSFASPEPAMLWLEWNRRGMAMPAIWLSVLLAVLLIGSVRVVMDWSRAIEVLQFQIALGLFAQGYVSVVIGLFLGHRNQSSSRVEFDSYSATRPVTNSAMSWSVLRSTGRALLACYAIIALLLVPMVVWTCLQGDLSELRALPDKLPNGLAALGVWRVPLVIGLSLLATWAGVGLSTSIVLAGRPRFLVAVICTFFGIPLLWVVMLNTIITSNLRPQAAALSAGLFGLACLGGTLLAFSRALRQRFVRTPTACLSALGWLLLCTVLVIVWQIIPTPNPAPYGWLAWPLLPGLLALPFAPLATAPLALAWNRHR